MKSNNNILNKQTKSLHYVYIVHCSLTGEYYFGKHSTDDKVNDPYKGSGKELNKRKKELGKEHFKICYIARFSSESEAYDREEDLIRVFISDIKCLNKVISSRGSKCDHSTYVYPSGKTAMLHINDPDVLSGLAVGIMKDFAAYILNGENVRLKTNDPRVLSGEAVSTSKGFCIYILNGEKVRLKTNDPRVLSGEAIHNTKGKPNKDKGKKRGPNIKISKKRKGHSNFRILSTGEIKYLHKDDPLVKNGLAVGIQKGKKNVKVSEIKQGMSVYKINDTGEIKQLHKDDPLVKNGKAVGINKGKPNKDKGKKRGPKPKISEARKMKKIEPWNKGKKCPNISSSRIGIEPWNKCKLTENEIDFIKSIFNPNKKNWKETINLFKLKFNKNIGSKSIKKLFI